MFILYVIITILFIYLVYRYFKFVINKFYKYKVKSTAKFYLDVENEKDNLKNKN